MRTRTIINDGWEFFRQTPEEAVGAGEAVNLPHTWNAADGQDGGDDYLRCECCYKKRLSIAKKEKTAYFLDFLGANSVCRVFVNGRLCGGHRGGYTRFFVDITDAVQDGENDITIGVSNEPFPDVVPLKADFTFFGGIYRDAALIEAEDAYFAPDENGCAGISITVPNDEEIMRTARLCIDADIAGDFDGCLLRATVRGAGAPECEYIKKADFTASELDALSKKTAACGECEISGGRARLELSFASPALWNGREAPFCYEVLCEIIKDGRVCDSERRTVGFRYFRIDGQRGAFLNGRRYPLRGVNRHQDRKDMGWAISEKEHAEDFALIYEMGANAIRLAHYPHHPYFYELCDRYGLLVWAEIPFVDHIGGCGISPLETDKRTDPAVTASTLENAKRQYTELIAQQKHRPSIFCWSMSNEIQREYGGTAAKLMGELNELAHSLDKTRYTALATNHHGGEKWPSDIKGCNIYPGWYWGSVREFALQAKAHIRAHGGEGVAVSEYGAGSNIEHHTERPRMPKDTTCDFHPEEWASIVHEHALKYFMKPKADKIWGAFVWNMFDFAIDSRNEGGIPGRNDKGLVTYDRKTKKDAFFLYKSYWSRERVLYITSRRFTRRKKKRVDIKIYSNEQDITLYVNGRRIGTKSAAPESGRHIFVFKRVALQRGKNIIKAVSDSGLKDEVIWQRV